MAIRITEDGVVNYENSPDINKKLFPNLNTCGKEIDKLAKEINGKAPAVFGTASGSTASFDIGADDMPLKSCVVSFGPIQEGTGDPSPENVRPISGRTGLNVVRCGKNLFPAVNGAEYSGNLLSVACNNGEYTLTIGRYPLSVDTIFPAYAVDGLLADKKSIPAGTYTFSVAVSQWTAETELQASRLKLILTDNVTGSTVAIKNGQTETLTHDCTINSISCDRSYAMPASSVTKFTVQLEVGSTATEYEPYQADTYSVNWETEAGTVYGGTIDVVSGKLVVDRAKTTLDGTNTVANVVVKDGFTNCQISGYTPVAKNYATPTTYPKAVCSDAKVIAVYYAWQNQDIPTANSFTVNGSHIGMSIPGSFADANAIKAYLVSHNVDVCYEIATPTEIQLTPQEVRTLLGVNNVWSDGGDISVEYPADTKTYIDTFSIKTVEVSGQTPTIVAEENTRYICGEVTSLDFTPCESGICDVRFTAASISTVLTLPETVKLPEWFDPTLLEAGTTYEINILDGIYGVVMSWA